MIIPCDDANGCGTFSVMTNMPNLTNPPIMSGNKPGTPVAPLPYQSMNGSSQAAPSTNMQMAAPTTSNIPTAAGIVATQGTGSPELVPGGITAGAPIGELPTSESVFANAPTFTVPPNPLVPPGYQEVLDYTNLQYLNGFLRSQIGKYVRVQQLIGSNILEDRYGYLIGVGINYILLQELNSDNILALDFYNIKYVYIFNNHPELPTNGAK